MMRLRNSRAGLTLLEAVVVGLLLCFVLWALLLQSRGCGKISKNGAARAQLHDLARALEMYESDFGSYPASKSMLVADSRFFIACLRNVGPKRVSYYSRDDDIHDGQLLSPFRKPIFYTYPAAGAVGPDGNAHNVPYYLWTWGCESDAPDADWEINNWSW